MGSKRLGTYLPYSWIEGGDFFRDGLHVNGKGKRRFGQIYVRATGLEVGGSSIQQQKTLHEAGPETCILTSREVEEWSTFKSIVELSAYRIEGKSLVLLLANCTCVYNKALEFWNLLDTYNPDGVIDTES
jgi:hypothetical protein